MTPPQFDGFFQAATKKPSPYDYQRRVACGERNGRPEAEWLASGTECSSRLINIPTGLGKTAAVTLAWIWNRVQLQNLKWPRRLVYCLPMRTLVDQTQEEVQKWLKAHDLNWNGKPENRKGKVGVHILMGGEEAGEWDIYPEENTILIGTQDMLLNRALNRGYGMSRYRWPMHFGLLNNDCLWVMDETQLMGVGVETSAQLDGFRHSGKMPTFGACPTWWMSATLDKARLATVDQKSADDWAVEKLSDTEQSSGRPHDLITAAKKLSQAIFKDTPAPFTFSSTTKDYAGQIAKLVKDRHQTGALTLVVVNRVSRAREIYEALTVVEKKSKQRLYDPAKVALIHSRFRPIDRERHTKLLFGKGDRIVIATQAVEAGVDVSARLLITELAPWSSLVQRMGRCNRRAEFSDAEVLWVDIEPDVKGELLLPYTKDDLEKARAAIAKLADASPRSLGNVDRKDVTEAPIIRPIIRRRDLVDLFDTTPDICGQDLDVSRYIRDSDDNDVQFFWRDIKGDAPPENEPAPVRAELCRVSIGDATKFLGKKTRAWRWNPLNEGWGPATSARPGSLYLVNVSSGGYNNVTGWTGDTKDKPTPCPPSNATLERYAGNRLSFDRDWQTIAAHTALVVAENSLISTVLGLTANDASILHSAALWHDVGKAHEHFQKMLRDGPHRPDDAAALYAKSKNPLKTAKAKKEYRGLRHELASALAWLLKGPTDTVERDLIAYLIAAHHGKVRLSIRSLPEETGDERNPEKLFARGIWQGDTLPAVPLGEITTPEITLDLSFMKMGESKEYGPSWLARTVALRDRIDLGPFRLAYLETLLRAADARASRETT